MIFVWREDIGLIEGYEMLLGAALLIGTIVAVV
jgi:hypothetical protein